MDKRTFSLIEKYMTFCMEDSAHDKEHIYRVLYHALEIAKSESDVNYDILITSCLLHDIGRVEQYKNPNLCHAMVGSEKAYRFLIDNEFAHPFAEHVKQCILTHRFRKDNPPQSIEAKILFDADKLDTAGAIGIARTLLYKGTLAEPIYSILPNGTISNGENDRDASFFQEYKYKLERIYSNFYTTKGTELAQMRKKAAVTFYESLLQEAQETYEKGLYELSSVLSHQNH